MRFLLRLGKWVITVACSNEAFMQTCPKCSKDAEVAKLNASYLLSVDESVIPEAER